MARILFLAHRAPFPPDKGDKIRAHHLLAHLAQGHEVWLGAGADDLGDLQHRDLALERCRDVCFAPLGSVRRAWNMLRGAATGAPLSVARFRHPGLQAWVDRVLADVRPDVVLVFSSAMAQYVAGRLPADTRLIIDFVDADAEKWRAYAAAARPPLRWLYAAEHRRLVAFERRAVREAAAGVAVSDTERRLLATQMPAAADRLHVISNGVDIDYFAPVARTSAQPLAVFCGRMDYAPNVDAAQWFAHEAFPAIRRARPDAVFRIVGAAPTAAVRALAGLDGVEVTGAVPDVRPHLAEAAAVVAPLRIARGVQNKVLEGMAAGRPVVATSAALDGLAAEPGRDVLVADDAQGFATQVLEILEGRAAPDLGRRARAFVVARHRWEAQLRALDGLIEAAVPASGQAAA
jgi:sugar transferase (PEP-CTERM/EpsH1 system associated)